jgi:hypothetical protein
MQYYEIEEDSTSPTINKITESKAALANGLLGFQMNLVHSTAGISLDLGSPVTSSVSADDNILGPCDGGATPSGACRYRTTDSDQLPVHNVFGEGADDSTDNCCDFFLQIPFYCDGGAEGGGRYASSWGNPPLKLTCEDDLCKAYSGGNGYASGPGLSCEFLEKNTGPCEGEGCGKGGCASCAEYDPKNPYTLYYRLQTTNNEFIKTGTGMTPCPCTVYPCPFKIGVSSTMTTQQGVILWNNWVLGKDLKDSNFYGSRTFSGATPLNVNDPFNTKGITTEPIFDTDYDIQPPNCNSIDGTCTGNRCTQDPDSPKTGWINGEWTFPLTTQSTSPTPNKQDTLNYMFARWGKNAMTNSLTLPSDPKPLVPIPTLPPNTYAGLALWLRDLVNSVQTTYSSDQGPGFIRDYMIAKTFASAYCSTLYGSVNVALLKDQNNVFPNQARVNWGYLNITDFIDVWQGSQLVGDSPTASFNKILMDRISDSFNETPGNDLPFLTQLRGITLLNNQQLDPFPVDGNDVYLQVPVDVFRMQQILKNTSSITTENFNDIIITPLLRGNTAINGIITPPGDKNPSKEPSPQFESNEDGSLKATYKYSGLTYVNPTTVFATTCKTKSGDYNSQIVTITDLSVIDKNSLWPLNTHATINSQNQVVSEDGGNGTPMIECLYYITVKIKKWSPALAFLYLATNEGRTVIPQQVYQKIYHNTTLVPNEYIGVLCSNPDGTNDMSKCKDMILQNCSTRYINDNFIFQPDDYFLLYNGRNSQGICACINSSLVPVSSKTVTGNIAAMCFDEQCATQYIPNSNPRININDLLGLSDGNCRTQCGALNDLLKGQASNIENLNTGKYNTLCGQTITTTFNTTFFVQLMIPTIIITALIPLGFGINKASIIVMVLTLLTLTGVSFYLGKLFAQLTECDTIGAGGKLPLCVSSMNPDMELPLSFCNINMFCECAVDGNCNTGCTCKSGVCVDKSGTRATETVYVKTINVQMLVLSSSLLILVPILIHLLRKRFFPKLSTFFEFCIIALSISIFGTVLYLSLVYEKPRLVYKGICGKKKNPGPAPGPTSVCDTQKFSPTILEQPGLPVGYFPCNTTVTLGDKPVTYKCPDGGVTCRELLKKTYPNATDNIGCLGRWNNANSDFCTIQYPDPNKGNLIPYTKKTGCNPDLENAVECSQ